MRIVFVTIILLLLTFSSGFGQEVYVRLSVDQIINHSWKLINRIAASGSAIEYTDEDLQLIDYFKNQAVQLHNAKKIRLSKEKSAYLLAGKSINTLGTLVNSMKSNKDINMFVTKLIKIGKSHFPGKRISNQEAITTALIIDSYKKL